GPCFLHISDIGMPLHDSSGGCRASVGYKDLLSARILLSAKQSAEGTFFVHFPYTLKLGIQKNVI
ncbi:hypothetical protein SAMN04487833_1577, partial [Sarcina sp. DSM 11001]|uniref:hypothetical protein n=1 Tax=Sarcina sp. DSM 11001 TaxID=1798184 RepID=UPI00088DE695